MKSQIFRSVTIIGIFTQCWSPVQHRSNRRIRSLSSEGQEDTHRYYEKYDQFTAVFSREGMVVPGEKIVQGTPISYLLFDFIDEKVFRISLSRIFNLISDFYEFEINHSQIRMLANTVLNSFWSHLRRKETMQKMIRLPYKIILCIGDCFVYLKELYKLSNFIEELPRESHSSLSEYNQTVVKRSWRMNYIVCLNILCYWWINVTVLASIGFLIINVDMKS